ncbi:ABC transporter substrate-binding protein [Rhodoferax sp.]|uniref:ABC transporter substrate-binding protein n=1 Tax=Rhodoferax sp. TaxID=50421 RepID=UPI00271BD277|nr:ABC transporter substrate-binding protein [Rhodoferax sp.]MDO9146060.1 ABC transporter substrate-binding protein [Rhodoferax sp.]MDP3191615.1 ABC transporter substrate-binding protein [Rhodoferax sp.]MDP3864772.1 ABC transporter substrate-binding protein [Rhodoferax sp.]
MTLNRRQILAAGTLACGIPLPLLAQSAGVLNIALFPEPPTLLAAFGGVAPAQLVNGNIYESLLRFDEKLQPQPNLATSWTVSKDALLYTFKLKRGVTWHDGKPFTAADVVYTADVFMRKLNPRFRLALASVQSIQALDTHTVEFRLSSPFPPFIQLFDVNTFPIVPKHQFEDSDLSRPPAVTPIGTGPYMFKEWKRGSSIQLVRSPSYHVAGLPAIENVYFHVIPDAASRAAAFESGRVDVLPGGSVEFFDVGRLSKLPGVSVTTKGSEKLAPLAMLWINHRTPLLQDVRVRRALMHAINRNGLAKVAWQGFAEPATGPLHRSTAFYTSKVNSYPYDAAKAKKLLADAGYKGEPVRLLGIPFGEVWTRTAEMVRQNLLAAGFNVQQVNADLPGVVSRQSNWDFDLAFTFYYQYGDPAIGVARNYISSEIKKGSTFNNVGGYESAKVDAMFERGGREVEPSKRAESYAEVQRTMVDDVAAAWLLELNFPTVYRSRIDNVISSALGLNDSLARATLRN